jgi:hypothetical protein
VYSQYINHSRPVVSWEHETPPELLAQLDQPPKNGWTHWYFSFRDNLGLTDEKRRQIETSAPVGSKLYKNKILGLRGRATGLVFDLRPENIVSREKAKSFEYTKYSCGVDTSYSRHTDDAFAFVFTGFTSDRRKVVLACEYFNNRDLKTPMSPSDIPRMLVGFLEKCRKYWGFGRDVFVDAATLAQSKNRSADAFRSGSADQATMAELHKYKRNNGCLYSFVPSYKKLLIIDRINLELGWLNSGRSLVVDTCAAYIREMNTYSWQEDKNAPEDRNDHAINAGQYAWIPFVRLVGDGLVEKFG